LNKLKIFINLHPDQWEIKMFPFSTYTSSPQIWDFVDRDHTYIHTHIHTYLTQLTQNTEK